ncbi:hypothetical protein M9H77_33065 [Catharanthus roseus]|uniref:Uncharacterized protein n=1 Tax=Catharanthus roseus TaxID=4058 RepID=A0ACC0A797_CATRO|nr:hypothetical protein M9H77_33065 [Catharanthus roseus]
MGLFFTCLVIGIVAFYGVLRRVNEWIYLRNLGSMMIPPGDLCWPFIGNMFSFLRAFKFGNPDSFISSLVHRFGKAPMYRAFLFGKPSIIVINGEACRKVLTDDRFGPGWPQSVSDLLGKKALHGVSIEEHRRLRKLIAMPIAGQEALSSFIEYIKEIAENSFEKWSQKWINQLNFKSMTINFPGFAYYKALRHVDVGNGRKLSDEEIVDLIIIYFLAGNESTGHAVTWAIMLLQKHPQFLQKAKEEQEEIVKRRASREIGLNLSEVKQMKYLEKVIDETLRVVNISFALFREAKTDVVLNGYTVPKGWKVLPWIRSVHNDPQNYENPYDFNPSRWDDQKVKVGAFIPFGAGPRYCPGREMAKLDIYVFLHYFLLNYRLEPINPECEIRYLPITCPADKCLARIKKLSLYT